MLSDGNKTVGIIDDLSGSKFRPATQYELDCNKEFFECLSRSIDLEIKEYSVNLDKYIENSLKKIKSKNREKSISGQVECDSKYDWFSSIVPKVGMPILYLWRKGIATTIFFAIFFAIMIYLYTSKDVSTSAFLNVKEDETKIVLTESESDISNIQEPDAEYENKIVKVESTSIPIPASYENVEKEINILQDNNSVAFEITTANGEVYTGKDLLGFTLLIPYSENDKEIYFLGQYDEKYRWDGHCITNIYNSDGTLYGVCEYDFGNGKCIKCKSFYRTETEGEWVYLDRFFDGDNRYGESIRYLFRYDEAKDFTSSDVDPFDIICADKFVNNINAIKLSYYMGNMSNGTYNDESGNAYFISYFRPEELDNFKISDDERLNLKTPVIKTLYKGGFKDGAFYEEDYDSWYITRKTGTTYMYFKGGFLGNHPQHKDETKEIFENHLTREQIDNYLEKDNLLKYSSQFLVEYENSQG